MHSWQMGDKHYTEEMNGLHMYTVQAVLYHQRAILSMRLCVCVKEGRGFIVIDASH